MKKVSVNTKEEKIIEEYEKQGNEIIQKMLTVVIRAQRKIDDAAYRKTLEKIQ